jgi:hypothetical protein
LFLAAPQTSVGTSATGSATYYGSTSAQAYSTASPTDVTLTLTAIDATSLTASFTATVESADAAVKALTGDFHVCRAPDFVMP